MIRKIIIKKKQNGENFEIVEFIKISKFLRINSDKMVADSLNFIVEKKNI